MAELRAVSQPASVFARNSGEHWAGRLYIRRASPYLTRALLPTAATPDGVTWAMLASGLAAGLVLTAPGVGAATAAAMLGQAQILLDCCDGELARWRGVSSPAGIYLDRVAHHATEAALPIALGIRADGGWRCIGPETTLGLLAAVLGLLAKAESTLVHVARLEAGLGRVADTAATAAPGRGVLRGARRAARALPVYRAFVAVEATGLALGAAVVDARTGGRRGSRALVRGLVGAGALTVAGHLAAVLTSDRLR
jgi:hypothetical protein